MKKFLTICVGVALTACSQATAPTGVSAKFESIKGNDIALRQFIQGHAQGR